MNIDEEAIKQAKQYRCGYDEIPEEYELESCPFCGRAARISYGNERGELYVIAMCCSCGIRTPNFYYTNNITERNDAIMMVAKRWNRRVNDGRGI